MQLPEECNFKYPELFWKEKANRFTATIDSKLFKETPFDLGDRLNHFNNYTFVYFESKDGQVSQHQHKTLMTFIDNQDKFKKEIGEAILNYLNREVKELLEPTEYTELLTRKPSEMVLLHHVHIRCDDSKSLGFEFECSWDYEHGFGIKHNGDSIINVGTADVAF
jgi:hypothetical protein